MSLPREQLILLGIVYLFVYLLVPFINYVFIALVAVVLIRHFFVNRKMRSLPGAVLVTGCGSGFGDLTARELARLGVTVYAGCHKQEAVDRLAALGINKLIPFVLDVTNETDIKGLTTRISSSPEPLWAVINSAGIAANMNVDLAPLSLIQRVMDVNFYGNVRVIKEVLPFLKKSRGRIVNISSIAGIVGFGGGLPYCASKYCIEALSDSLRRELIHFGVRVVCLRPGYFSTPMLSELANRIDATIALVPAEKRAEYGEKYFEDLRSLFKFLSAMPKGDPLVVRDALIDALYATHPPSHWNLGNDANFFFVPVSLLPGFIQDFVMKGIDKAPVPALAKMKQN